MDFRRHVLFHVVLSLVFLCVTARAYAAPSAAERDTARSLMDEGDRMCANGKLRDALERYRAAHAIMHVPTTGIELARMQAQLGLLVEARATAMEVVNLPRTEADAQAEPAVFHEARAAAVTLVRDLEPRVPSLQTTVTPENHSYQVSVDGMRLPAEASSVPFRTNPGAHVVRVEARGFATEQRDVFLEEGQALALSLHLTPVVVAEEAPSPKPVLAAPASALRSDDILDARASGRTRGIIGLGIGAAALIAGSVTGLIALAQTKQEQERCPDNHCDVSRADALDTANIYANVSNVSFAVGALGVLYGSYELLTLPSAPDTHGRTTVELGIGGIRVRGTL